MAALAKSGRFDCLLIESTGISEPLPVAETFTFDLDDEEEEVEEEGSDVSEERKEEEEEEEAGDGREAATDGERTSSVVPASLRDVARLDSMVTVVDGFNFLKDLGSTTSLAQLGAQVRKHKQGNCKYCNCSLAQHGIIAYWPSILSLV